MNAQTPAGSALESRRRPVPRAMAGAYADFSGTWKRALGMLRADAAEGAPFMVENGIAAGVARQRAAESR